MHKNEKENCPCCPRHCQSDDLHCGRGENYFNSDTSAQNHSHGHGHHDHMQNKFEPDSLPGQLMQCAHSIMHAVHHSPDFDEDKIFSSLSAAEKSELLSLLKKLNSNNR